VANSITFFKQATYLIRQDTQDAPQVGIRIMQTWTTIGNMVYLLLYSAKDSKFQEFLPTVEQMLISLQVQQ
jgi:hypothetical protein